MARPPPCLHPWGPPPPRAFPGWGRDGFKTPRRPSRSPPPPPPFAPRAVPPPPPSADPPDSEAPGRGLGGHPPAPGDPPARSHPWGRHQPGAEEGDAEEQPEAPASETSRRPRRCRHCGEEGEEEREEGRAGREKRKKVLRLFRCHWELEAREPFGAALSGEEAGLGDPRPPPHRLERLLPPCLHVVPQAPPFRTSPQEPQTRLLRSLDPKTSGAPPCTPPS